MSLSHHHNKWGPELSLEPLCSQDVAVSIITGQFGDHSNSFSPYSFVCVCVCIHVYVCRLYMLGCTQVKRLGIGVMNHPVSLFHYIH